ncbi:MAG: ANTAR domain-containing protein [Clostridiales bacterium]|nr:ANTAR domain-containing protein [Candidatus Blautia equi]
MGASIVVVLPKIEDAKKIQSILVRHGFTVASVCNSGGQALDKMTDLERGVLICGYHMPDMYYRDVLEYMPKDFQMLLLASERVIHEAPNSILTVSLPMKTSELVNTINMMLSQIERRWKKEHKRPKQRSEKEQNYINNAKMMLMERNHLSEDEAYRYIQKCSMDSGNSMVESAQMLLLMIYDEV